MGEAVLALKLNHTNNEASVLLVYDQTNSVHISTPLDVALQGGCYDERVWQTLHE